MSTLKSIIFETLPDPDEYYETAEALRDLDRQYQHFTRTVWKASKQLLKFDEINRLVAYEVEEKAPNVTTGRSSSGRSSSSSKSSTTSKPSAKSTSSKTGTPADDPFAKRAELEEKYMADVADGVNAAKAGYVDDVIEPAQTRQILASALEMLSGKREAKAAKKHGNMPL